MDAVEEEQDVHLQKASSGLLADLESSLKPFIWRTTKSGTLRIRRKVRARETDRLLRLLDTFQELPQLLDPHLERLLPALAEAYLESLRSKFTSNKPARNAELLIPVSKSICQLLYTFCKVRGEKVVVRFFNPEIRNLELLLSAVEAAEVSVSDDTTKLNTGSTSTAWSWEERYISFLWLSHLLLAPFDLATISSFDTADIGRPEIQGLVWPEKLPGITLRVVPLAIKYLASAGKERDAAKTLLVRISIRRDMQELGMLYALVQWALSYFHSSAVVAENSIYFSIGILSYLAGVLVSSTSTSDMDLYLLKIFRTVQTISSEDAAFRTVNSSALARRTVIKVLRAIAVLSLRGKSSSSLHDLEAAEIVEITIGHLLEALADNDTPVRLAASKALSAITLKLAPVMATQVVEAVLDALTHNVLWVDKTVGQDHGKTRDLSAVNPLEWHGLILTLSHLLYRRSPPTGTLPDILHALLTGLSFERRTTSGSSVGTNVRDAACFGIWALARRYTTAELQSVVTSSVLAAKQHDSSSSMIQILATELVVIASLDPAGNIRRGASAALQELIGRHPDTVAQGIAVVQVVDYHAVALRSRAMLEVAPKSALLSRYYEDALLDALLAWRGVGDGDPSSRRTAAAAIGLLAKEFRDELGHTTSRVMSLMERIEQQLHSLKAREIDQRHGLLLSMAAVLTSMSDFLDKQNVMLALAGSTEIVATINQTFRIVITILRAAKSSTDRRVELIAEGVSRVILSTIPMLRTDLVLRAFGTSPSERRSELTHPKPGYGTSVADAISSVNKLDVCHKYGSFSQPEIVALSEDLLINWLRRSEKHVIAAATEATANLMLVIGREKRSVLVENWISEVSEDRAGRVGPGYFFALADIFPIVGTAQQDQICHAFLGRWQATVNIESRVIILQSLTRGSILDSHASAFIDMISIGLDDYTTDGRGDIGSLVRIEALRAARRALSSIPWSEIEHINDSPNAWFRDLDKFSALYGKILRLSAEKLDRVRVEAQQSLIQVCRNMDERQRLERFSISSFDYFRWLLDLQTHNWLALPLFQYEPSRWRVELFEGLVSSADAGSEDLIRVSRAAIVDFCERGGPLNETFPGRGDACHFVCESILEVAKKSITNDRVLVPTLEAMSFLFDAGIMQRSKLKWPPIYLLVQKAHYKTGNVRKLEAAIKLYGGILQVYPEALQKLTTMLLHPFPKVRNQVADTVFVARGVGKGVNWTKAGKEELMRLKQELNGHDENVKGAPAQAIHR